MYTSWKPKRPNFDLLVIESEVPDRRLEMMRLRPLQPLQTPLGIPGYSSADLVRESNESGSTLVLGVA